MAKKPKKTREEKIAEAYFPIDEDDIKLSIEKKVKKPSSKEELPKKTVEKRYKKPYRESL